MNAAELRSHLKDALVRDGAVSRDALLVEELGVRHGKGRIDLAIIGSVFVGFEIKSERD